MRNKIAKALRKSLNYKINSKEKEERNYKTLTMESSRKHTLRYNFDTGEFETVRGGGKSELIECVSGARKMYKYLKRKYMNFEHEETLTPLPNQEELMQLEQQIIADMTKEKDNE